MFTRRQFLAKSLGTASLVAFSTAAPAFIPRTAAAAGETAAKDTVLVVIEMTGGNDGLNTVIPHGDDLYHKARPTLRLTKDRVLKIDDHTGLHPGLKPLEAHLKQDHVAVVQGVGYPNPDRSHFESMDIWQSADPTRKTRTGWLGRGIGGMKFRTGAMPVLHIDTEKLPLALGGSDIAVPTVHPNRPYDFELGLAKSSFNVAIPGRGNNNPHATARRDLITSLAEWTPQNEGDLTQFVRRSQLQTYGNLEKVRKIMSGDGRVSGLAPVGDGSRLVQDLQLVAQLINADLGTRVFYLAISGFDTHSDQAQTHELLLQSIGNGIANLFALLKPSNNGDRVLVMTYSEFGRRVSENGSRGTDHGAGSSMFLIGPKVKGGLIGKHPSLDDLDNGDLKHHIDFRQVYAALLDHWLGCDSKLVLGDRYEPLELLRSS